MAEQIAANRGAAASVQRTRSRQSTAPCSAFDGHSRRAPTRRLGVPDVVATFRVAGALRLRIAVQAKHYGRGPAIGERVIEQLLSGMDAEDADIGSVASSGAFSDEAVDYARAYKLLP